MPAKPKRPPLMLTEGQRSTLTAVSRSRTDEPRRVERSRILLAYAEGNSIAEIVRTLGTYRRKVERLVDKALELEPLATLNDLKRRGRPPEITPQARAWLLDLACQKPIDLGYSYELWTTDLLARHARKHCRKQGHPTLARLARGTMSKIAGHLERHTRFRRNACAYPIQTLIDYLEGGETIDDFLEGFPAVKRERVVAFLDEATARMIAKAS